MNAVELMRYLLAQLAPYGIRATITSGVRSRQEQQQLYRQRGRNPYPVARPGMSKHELGRAVDVSADRSTLEVLARYWESWGGIWGGRWRSADPVHFEF